MAEEIKIYDIGDNIVLSLVGDDQCLNLKFLGIDDRGFFVFKGRIEGAIVEYCVPESSISYIKVQTTDAID